MKMKLSKSIFLGACAAVVVPALVVSCEKKVEATSTEKTEAPSVVEVKDEAEKAPAAEPKDSVAPVEPVKVKDEVLVGVLEETGREVAQDPTQPIILKDLSSIKVRPGSDSPKIGDKVYTFKNLPKGKCGEFWVQSDDGYVETLAVCSGDHAEGEGH